MPQSQSECSDLLEDSSQKLVVCSSHHLLHDAVQKKPVFILALDHSQRGLP
jgi:hypothetical protein